MSRILPVEVLGTPMTAGCERCQGTGLVGKQKSFDGGFAGWNERCTDCNGTGTKPDSFDPSELHTWRGSAVSGIQDLPMKAASFGSNTNKMEKAMGSMHEAESRADKIDKGYSTHPEFNPTDNPDVKVIKDLTDRLTAANDRCCR